MSRILIQNAAVVTVDPELGDFERADILIDDGAIVQVGPDISADAELIDASGMIAMPGMVDTHLHTWQSPVRGILADGNIPDYLRGIRLHLAELESLRPCAARRFMLRLAEGVAAFDDRNQIAGSRWKQHAGGCIEQAGGAFLSARFHCAEFHRRGRSGRDGHRPAEA